MSPKLRCMLVLMLLPRSATAGTLDSAAFRQLNTQRIHTEMKGMWALASWGLMHAVVGVAGATLESEGELKHFHQMNAAWGIVNLGIAGLGYFGARRELNKSYSSSRALHRYEATKRLYLINAGLDGLYMATGVLLAQREKHNNDAPLYRGFGKALILQGAGLLIFDVAMFSAHHRNSMGWYRALEGLSVTGNGIGWRYVIR